MLVAMPVAGPVIYLLFGDHSLGAQRLKLGQRIRAFYQEAYAVTGADAAPLDDIPEPFAGLSRSIALESGFPMQARNSYAILIDAADILERMRRDIDAARTSCGLEFYIIEPEGRVVPVLEAILRAAARGVTCQVLADDYGSKGFFRSAWPARLKVAGVTVVRSLPVALLKSFSKRSDLRNHRKLLICDRAVAYTGSFNLIDPKVFKAGRHVGAWVDIMMRTEGDVVDALTCVFNADFLFEEKGSDIGGKVLRPLPLDPTAGARGPGMARMQLLPSGPEMPRSTLYEFIVTAIFNARRTVRIVTPYLIPDQAVMLALTSAAKRGVAVQLIVPERLDTRIGQFASQATYAELLAAGVEIRRFGAGLLHAKAVLIDEDMTVFGTVNMDSRSFYLNLELSLIIYEPQVNSALRAILDSYVALSAKVDEQAWAARPGTRRFLENVMRLAAPVL
jgi:cardiolipin synthase